MPLQPPVQGQPELECEDGVGQPLPHIHLAVLFDKAAHELGLELQEEL